MKTQNKHRFLSLGVLMAFLVSAVMYSCKDEDPSLAELRADKLAFLADSLRISDSLKRINAAGVVNYSVTVVDGATSAIFHQAGKTQSALDGVIVTVSQFGKELSDTTDATGIAVFNGFFKSSVNVTIRKEGYTSVTYVAQTNMQASDSTGRGAISFVGNLIPIFPTTGPNTATISGVGTIQSDLTNATREDVPDGTTLLVGIDAMDADFHEQYLTSDLDWFASPACGCDFVIVGRILQASYATGIVGTITNGAYTVTVPAAINGLPLTIDYSDVALTQNLFENDGDRQQTLSQRAVFKGDPTITAAVLPSSASVDISFESNTGNATGTVVISPNAGTIASINVTNGGQDYPAGSNPPVEILGSGGSGTGATATATVGANGRITSVTVTNPGSGYVGPVTASVRTGSGAAAAAVLDGNAGQVFTIEVTNQGTGYTSAPTVGFTGGGGSGATATAQVANGRVVAVVVTAGGSAFTAPPTVTFTGGGGAGATADAILAFPVAQVNMITNGSQYLTTPTVTFSAPEMFNGTRAQGTAIIDVATRTVLGVQVTNVGSGYVNNPTVTITGGTGAALEVFLNGGSVINVDLTSQGSGYAYPPIVRFVGGDGIGATGHAVIAGGKVTGVIIDTPGSGYTTAPTIEFVVGSSATAYATVSNGAITGIEITDGGANYNGAPRVIITPTASTGGAGAAATATVTNGSITGITVDAGGSGYPQGNIPGSAENFSGNTRITTKPGVKYVVDAHWGTGSTRNPN